VSSYFVAQIQIHVPGEYKKYLRGFDQIFSKYDAEVVAVDDNPEVLEGACPYSRIVIIRFRDRDEARRWYKSAEYQELAQHRFSASDSVAFFVDGRD
jgi:uncharacterized protein (DUF1330 family)